VNDPNVLIEAKKHPTLRPFVVAYEQQSEELEASYDLLREAGDVTLQLSTEWMAQLEEACQSGAPTKTQPQFGTRC